MRDNIKLTITSKKNLLIAVILSLVFLSPVLMNSRVQAEVVCKDSGQIIPGENATQADCPIDTECDGIDSNDNALPLSKDNCGIVSLIVIGINFLAALAGIIFVASIMISGFQYMTGRDNAGQIEKAKARIVQTLIAIAVFIFMYALLEFLVPGGVFPV